MKKEVKIIGLSVNKDFGGLKATQLTFDENNRLTVVKGEVGSGKTTLNKALSLTTKGSKTLEDNNLYGDIDLTAQLLDGEYKVFVNCKSNDAGKIYHTIYTVDDNGNKLKDVVIDGQKLTPANYLKSLQTSLTWRLDELTSENPVTQRNILLELYQNKLQDKGVIFDKNHAKYTDSIIHQIEKAKNDRNFADMKRKEVGGIGEDLTEKGINTESRRDLKPTQSIEDEIHQLQADKTYKLKNSSQAYEKELNDLKTDGISVNSSLKDYRDKIKQHNEKENAKLDEYQKEFNSRDLEINQIKSHLGNLGITNDNQREITESILNKLPSLEKPETDIWNELQFNENGQCISQADDFDGEIKDLLIRVNDIRAKYSKKLDEAQNSVVDTSDIDAEINEKKQELNNALEWNREAKAVNALHDWKDANQAVRDLQNDYYKKLTEIDTGVPGLHIALENTESDNIFLMYDGSYDTNYFHNPKKELRKLSSYSDTQKPLICLLIQNYLLKNKGKSLPYLWIDKVPIDNKTKALLERMSSELDLWLFVSWTGDFDSSKLDDGELLIENGEIFFKGKAEEDSPLKDMGDAF